MAWQRDGQPSGSEGGGGGGGGGGDVVAADDLVGIPFAADDAARGPVCAFAVRGLALAPRIAATGPAAAESLACTCQTSRCRTNADQPRRSNRRHSRICARRIVAASALHSLARTIDSLLVCESADALFSRTIIQKSDAKRVNISFTTVHGTRPTSTTPTTRKNVRLSFLRVSRMKRPSPPRSFAVSIPSRRWKRRRPPPSLSRPWGTPPLPLRRMR